MVERVKAEISLPSVSATESFAARLAEKAEPGQFIALCGDLGAGKTTFTRALTQVLGCSVLATSPTFALFQRYPDGRLPVFHADLYRIGSEDELFELGWEEILEEFEDGLIIVEWADKFESSWPADYLRVDCSYGTKDEGRVFVLGAEGERSKHLLAQLDDGEESDG